MALKCTNNACGKEYNEEDNTDVSCLYHPGMPIFHEGLKGWSCCDKRFTDFTDFLNYPGCTRGRHSNEKKEKPAAAASQQQEAIRKPLEQLGIKLRDSDPKKPIEVKVTSSLTRALEQQKQKVVEEEASQEVKIGQQCTRNACGVAYEGPQSDETECLYHPGSPVFHEGMKYWSCCPKKKTHDFDEFLAMKGCEKGRHRWFKPLEEQRKAKQCRHDYFQTADSVVLTIFAKCIDPDSCVVMANTDSLTVKIVYELTSTFELELHFPEKIVPGKCSATIASTKMDIKLVKAEPGQWSTLSV